MGWKGYIVAGVVVVVVVVHSSLVRWKNRDQIQIGAAWTPAVAVIASAAVSVDPSSHTMTRMDHNFL